MTSPQDIPGFIKTLEPIIKNYGYFGIGGLIFLEDFGLPVPGETILIASAFYAGLGQVNVVLVGIIAFVAAILGDNVGFSIGKYGGHPLILKIGKYIFLTEERVVKAENFFKRYGARVVIVARFIEGLRQANGIIAGLTEMPWLRFITFNSIGAFLWVGFWVTVGYFGGNHIQAFLKYDLYISIVAGIGIVGFLINKFYKSRKKSKA